jgi:hypothetical protein
MVAGTTMATPIAQISKPTANSTGRRSSMCAFSSRSSWLPAAGILGWRRRGATAARDAPAPVRCQRRRAMHRRAARRTS